MSTEVDSRIVEMKFDSKDFEKNAQSTLSILDKLKEKLNFSDTKESFNSFDTSKLRKELDKIDDFDGGKLEGVFDKLEYRMSNMGIFTARIVENIADDIYNMVKKAMDNIGKVVTFAEQGIVQGGYNRAANIQSAKFQLEGLGIKWSEIYGDIDYAVTNTAYSLDQAAIVASQLASSGIKPGGTWKDLSGKEQDIDYMAMILRSISGTASATGGKADYADIGRIFTKMLSYGKVYTQNLNELATYGIGAKGIVADYLNQINYKGSNKWTEQKVQDVMSDRQGGGLDPQIVMEAFFNKFADHATAANETLTGVTANLRAALARVGEKFYEPIIKNGGPLVKFLDNFRKSINDLNKVLGPVTESLGRYVANTIEKINDKLFFETTEERDEKGNIVYQTDKEGNVIKDEEGNPIPKMVRSFKLGGIFSDFMKPWKESEWIKTNIGEGERRQGLNLPTEYLQEYETRAQKIAGNLLAIVKNIGSIITGIGKLFVSAFKGATDGGFSLAAVLVTVTTFLNNLTKTIADFVNAPEFVNSGIYIFFRFLADSVRIMISFAKSFKKHIIDPIFSAGKAAASASGVGNWFRDLFDRIHKFSLKLREEGNEDYFGPFLEKIKEGAKAIKDKLSDLFGGIGTIVKNGMRDIIDWWKPIKDIIFDTDLGFKDKMAAIKQYFSENFELPGWSKVKDIFGGIADAVGKAFNALKKFLGFGGKKNDGIPDPDQYEMVASKHDFSGVLGIQTELEKADKSTEKLTTIGDRLSNFFTKVGESFSNVDLGGIKGVTLALLAIVILLAVGIALAVKKVLDSMKKLVIDFPKIASDILKSFQGVLDEIAGMFKAQKYEIYTQALKNIAVATTMLTAVFIGLAGILAIVDHFGGGDKMADALKQAGAVIASIAGGLTVMLAAIILVTNLTSGKSMYGLSISKSGLQASAPSMALSSVASIISSFTKGIAILAGVVVVLGALSYIPGLLDRGFSALLKIVLILGASVIIFTVLAGTMTAINASIKKGTGANAFAGSMASIAGILTALTVGILILTPVIAALGILSLTGLFSKGIAALWKITIWMEVTIGILMGITAFVSKAAQLKASQIAATIFGLAAVVTAVTAGVLAFSIAMMIISRINGDGMIKSIFTLAMITGVLIGVPAILMKFYNKFSAVGNFALNRKSLNSMTLMILGMGAAVLAMSIGLRLVSASDPGSLAIAIAGIGIIFGVLAVVLNNLAKFDNAGLTKAAIAMGVMGGVIIAINTMLIILSRHLNTNMIIAGGIMIGEIAILAGMLYGLTIILNKYGKDLEYDSIVKFSKSMALVAAAILPISASLFIVMAAVGGFNLNVGQILASMGGMIAIIIALTSAVWVMLEQLGTADIKDKNLKAIAITILSMSAALALIAAALTAVFAGISYSGLSELGSIGVMIAFGAVIVAFGYALKLIITSLSKIKDAKKLIAPLAVTIAAIVIPLATIAGAVALLSRLPLSGVIAGGVVLFAMSGLCLWLSDWIMDMGRGMRWSNNLAKKIGLSLASYATITVSMVPLASALTLIAKQSVGKIWNAVAVLTVMGYAVAGMSAIVIAIGNRIKDVGKSLTSIGSFVGIAVSICAIALVLDKLRGFDFDEIADALKALGIVAGAAIVIAALFGLVPKIGAGALAAASMLLSVAVVMASVGVLLWLSAEALDKFVDVLLKIDGKTATLTSSLTGLLTGLVSAIGAALKQAIIGLANAISDPEIMNAISDAITGILTWIRDNIGVWTKLIIEIAATFVKAIVDAIDLYELGKWIDEKLLGGKISTTIDILVETNVTIEKANMISRLYATYSDEFQKLSQMMGYNNTQWEAMMEKHGSHIKGIYDYIIEAYNLGNEEYRQRIEEAGGLGAFMRNTLLTYYGKEGIVPKTKIDEARGSHIDAFINTALKNSNYNTAELKREQFALTEAGGLLKKALAVGWDSNEGLSLRALASKEIENLLLETKSKSLLAAADNLGVEISDKVRNAVLNNGGSTGLLDSQSFQLIADSDSFYKECDELGRTGVQRMRDAALKELEENGPIIGFNPQTNTTRDQILWGAQNKFDESYVYSPGPAPYRGSTASGLKKDKGNWWESTGLIDYNGLNDYYETEAYWSEVEKWAKQKQNNPFSTLNPGDLKNNINTWVNVLKDSGLTISDVEKRFGKDAADVYAKYFSLSERYIGQGLTSVANTTMAGFASLNNTLSTGGASGTRGVGSLSYVTLSNDLNKNYFNPLQGGLILGYATAGTAGVNQFSQTLGTTGQVLEVTRPNIENSISVGFMSPLNTFMRTGADTTGNTYNSSLRNVLSSGFSVSPKIAISPQFSLAADTLMSGLSLGVGSTNPLTSYITQYLGYNDVTTSPFRYSGEMITAGLMYGMQDAQSRRHVKDNAKTLSMTVVNYIKQAFKIKSPAKDEELIWASEMVVAGFSNSMTDSTSEGYIKEGTDSLADSTGEAMKQSMSGIDMSSVGEGLADSLGSGMDASSILDGFDISSVAGKLKNAITDKLPTWSFIQSQFGWDKGISGNIQGLKNVWGSIKDAFSGGLDLEGILEGSGLDVSKFTAGLNLENMGFSISANDIIDMQGINNEFAGFDVNDYTTNTDLSVKLDLDTSMADDWMKQNQSIDMATSIPVTGGYERSTTGSNTYVNNYSFNQNNTSPQALSARDTARYAELMLIRRLGWRAQ